MRIGRLKTRVERWRQMGADLLAPNGDGFCGGGLFGGRRSSSHRKAASSGTHLRIEQLEQRCLLAVVINEFLALNSTGIRDEDGNRSDWIELRNTSPTPVDLTNWYLTDDPNNLTRWQFPELVLPGSAYFTLFASSKDRAVAGSELHTNFGLSQNGESLLLVMPDGVTVAHGYDPFPPQLADISYGLGASSVTQETLIGEEAPVRVLVPTNNSVDSTWFLPGFDDSTWRVGSSGVGFDGSTSPVDFNAYINLDIGDEMFDLRNSAYIRMPFDLANPAELSSLLLRIRYEDGFALYLNGTEITSARRNTPNGTPNFEWNAPVSRNESQAIQYQNIDLTAHLHLLQPGSNVMAIHGLNRNTNSNDFLIDPLLLGERQGEPILGFMATPTPGAANQPGTLGVVDDTKFSIDRGLFDTPFHVEITTDTADAQIRYTLDGSEPTATHGSIYNPANPLLISTTTILRAAAFKAGYTPTNIDTQTYIFLDDVLQQNGVGLPASANWGHNGRDWEMDPLIVNDPLYSDRIKDDLAAVASVSLVMPWNEWFGGNGEGIYISGVNSERTGSVELLTGDGSEAFQIDAAIEIQGGTSVNRWNNDKLSMRITFKPPHGPTKLEASLFNDPLFDQGAALEFDTFLLDAVYNYSWTYGATSSPHLQRGEAKYIQDQYVADLQNLTGGHAPHGRYVHLYLNGLYWGMYYLHERPDDSFAEAYLGGDKDDYDVLKHSATEVVSGDDTAIGNFASLLFAVRQDMSNPDNYAAVEQMLDIEGFIDYMLVNYYVGNTDWSHHNWYATFNRVDPNGQWRFHSWDAEHVLKSVNDNVVTKNNTGSPTEIQNRLMLNPEFRLKFTDRVQEHFYNDGLLTPTSAAAVYTARMAHVDQAIVGESARWGDNRMELAPFQRFTRDHWLATQQNLLDNYFPIRTDIVLAQLQARGWLPSIAAPIFSNYGGTVEEGFELVLSFPPGTPSGSAIIYTLDGSDPRLPGGGIRSSAMVYTGPITIDAATRVQARILNGASSTWSPIIDATFLLDTPFPLRITELHYNPADNPGVADAQDLEFFELLNTSTQTISLDGVQIGGFAEEAYIFPTGLNLGAGERIIVTRTPEIFQQVYGTEIVISPAGYANRNLSNGGELVTLIGPFGEILQSFVYDDVDPWPTTPDGMGPSLEIIDPLGDPSDPANWRASFYVGGSPGWDGLAVDPIAGDFDGNGIVDMDDYNQWKADFGATVTPGTGADANGDGRVDAADYTIWRDNLGATQAAGSGVVFVQQAPVGGAALGAEPSSSATIDDANVAEVATAPLASTLPAGPVGRPDFRPGFEATVNGARNVTLETSRGQFRPASRLAVPVAAERLLNVLGIGFAQAIDEALAVASPAEDGDPLPVDLSRGADDEESLALAFAALGAAWEDRV